MRVPQSYIQKCKVTAHVFQGLLIFIAGCITLAVLTKGGDNGGPTKWYFALVRGICVTEVPGGWESALEIQKHRKIELS